MTRFDVLAEQVLQGHSVSREEGLELLQTDDTQLLPLVNAAYTIRHAYFGRKVTIQMLFNAKSGACQEDCHYCSQSSISTAPIDRYALVSPEDMLKAARRAHEAKAERYCVVISGRSPLEKEVDDIASAVKRIKQELPMQVCCSLGLLTEPQARRLKAAGVDRINHNLNTSEAYHSSICTTHTYQDRMTTLRNARAAGLELCSGGIVGMGESDEDLVDLALALKDLNPDSIPLNMLHPIPGTPLADAKNLTPQRCLKILCLFRFVHPRRELRAAGGREFNLRSLQPMALYVADSLFVNGYLTTPGDPAREVERMLADMGFEVGKQPAVPDSPVQAG
ncbi:MAG: biotin synthase BioB [Nitrospira sp.]|nr:biotin synthase BioB [Nitrospira sp.]